MVKRTVTTLYEGRAYIKGELLNNLKKTNQNLLITYKDQSMLITPDRMTKEYFISHPNNPFQDKHGRGEYKLFGIHFINNTK